MCSIDLSGTCTEKNLHNSRTILTSIIQKVTRLTDGEKILQDHRQEKQFLIRLKDRKKFPDLSISTSCDFKNSTLKFVKFFNVFFSFWKIVTEHFDDQEPSFNFQPKYIYGWLIYICSCASIAPYLEITLKSQSY